ncbi:conserved hypothetical protein [Xenorhabdus nematophila ATCC 19061]|uniref:ATP-grasp domain-containing protein n=1 Tax=Xenorhabdus nematophila (strain ATCC 19061 / DSM 3370 / CCUG 14189 / LMG 1036 / NCIMB 9965 / AN6) TaxID=406817 RepID=D3V9H6_XENNA|nr:MULTISPECIES: ATP-grasp domain-containing protein [Xenorhabdus]MDE1474757.1 ATP-grasp domain-containing protein [Xenorhabdus bovienii]CBJ91526.1 conserved hypothetical protein [Xenorhabdus nematophila ATCC 19061]CEK24349.1 conserved hypothetical protein [Xenorhabdus nematophila AN6/1]
MKHIVFIDANNSTIQSMDEALKKGYKVTFFRQSNAFFYQNNVYTQSVLERLHAIVDMQNDTDDNEIAHLLGNILRHESIDGVIAPLDRSLEAVAEACKRCDIPFTNLQGVKNARDKSKARAILREHHVPTIRSWVAYTPDEANAIFTQYTSPFIFKPVSGFDSLHAVKVSTHEEVTKAAMDILNAGKNIAQPYREIFSRGILIEEFLSGMLISAEVGIYNGLFFPFMISGRSQSRFNECIELGSLMPAALSNEQKIECFEYAKSVCRALVLDHGIFHIEMMYTKTGPILVEANPRLMGGVMPEIYHQATGESIYPALFTIAMCSNDPISISMANRAVTVRKIMPLADGIISDDFYIDDIKNNPNLVNFYADKLLHSQNVHKNEVLGRIMVAHNDLDKANLIADEILLDIESRIGIKIHQPL